MSYLRLTEAEMAFLVDTETGAITLVQGDSGTLVVSGIDTDKNYKVFFSIYDENGVIIGNDLYVNSNYSPVVTFKIPPSLTDLLIVNGGINDTAEYYYGIKTCFEETDFEDTLCVGNRDIGELNTITVYPKKVEGING